MIGIGNATLTVAVLFHRLGPYHLARFRALSGQFAVVEFSKVDNTYLWDAVDTRGSYPMITLFNDADVETKHVSDLRVRFEEVLGGLSPNAVAIPGWSSRCSDGRTGLVLRHTYASYIDVGKHCTR